MFKQITDLDGNEWYLIASLVLFLVFFIVVGIMLFRMKKSHVKYMKNLPLEKKSPEKSTDEQQESTEQDKS